MKNIFTHLKLLLPLLVVAGSHAQDTSSDAGTELAGTSWQLVMFLSGDGSKLTPDDKTKYTIAFDTSGSVSVRIDCNHGRGTWKSAGANQIEFGPLALTRAMCPEAPLNERIPKHWGYVRSYIMKEGYLFLALMADGGTYEFEPMLPSQVEARRVTGTASYRERIALPAGAVFEATLEDVSRADADATILAKARVEHPTNPPIIFEITYDPAKITAGHSYLIRGRITVEGHVFFATTNAYPVLTQGYGKTVDLLLQRSGGSDSSPEASLPGLPATFIGTWPCADCPGIFYQVNLLPDHTFLSRMTYQDRPSRLDDRGHWQLAEDGKTLILQGEQEAPARFALHDSHNLRKLDSNGNEITSNLNYDLKRAPAFLPIESTNSEIKTASLENSYWKLTRLLDAEIKAPSGEQEPHFVLNPDTHRVSGADGCNRLSGSYQIDGDRITFSQMISTMMACVEGTDTEKAFRDALNEVSTWKITGRQLELFDASGKLRATFESRPM